MNGSSQLLPSRTAAGLLLMVFMSWAMLCLRSESLVAVLRTNIKDTVLGSTLFAFLAVFLVTLFASLLGRVLAWFGLWLADRRGRDKVYEKFSNSLPDEVTRELDGLMSAEIWDTCGGLSSPKRHFLLLSDHLAASDFGVYSEARRSHATPTGLLREVAAVFLVGGLVLTAGWSFASWQVEPWFVALGKCAAGFAGSWLACEGTMRLYFKSLMKEMRNYLRLYMVVRVEKSNALVRESGDHTSS